MIWVILDIWWVRVAVRVVASGCDGVMCEGDGGGGEEGGGRGGAEVRAWVG